MPPRMSCLEDLKSVTTEVDNAAHSARLTRSRGDGVLEERFEIKLPSMGKAP